MRAMSLYIERRRDWVSFIVPSKGALSHIP